MKKFVSILLTLVMLFSLGVSAFAEDPETFTLTLNGAAGHTYDIYQIYTGDLSYEQDKPVLSNVKYGLNHYPVDTGADGIGSPVPLDELSALESSSDPVALLDSAVKGTPYKDNISPNEKETSIVIEGIPAGYYMIVDVTTDLPDGQTKSPIILQVLETTTITSKHATIYSEKKVADKNDSIPAENDDRAWHDVADYDLGDKVPFQLSVTLPTTMDNYDTYELTFHDKLADAFIGPVEDPAPNVYILKADGVTKININKAQNGVPGYTIHTECPSKNTCEFGGCSFAVTVSDINALYGEYSFVDGDKLVVEYSAVLNAPTLGYAGNVNSMYVCHPDGHTVQDDAIVLSYGLEINKVDGEGERLEGAGFTLSKWNAETSTWVAVGDEKISTKSGPLFWPGIDGGKYKLEETTVPTGYNDIAAIEFEVDAVHATDWTLGTNSPLYNVTTKSNVFVDIDAEGLEDGVLTGQIVNYKGAVLPETGAEGTAMLIGFSTMLVLVAAVFMITRKKMSIYED